MSHERERIREEQEQELQREREEREQAVLQRRLQEEELARAAARQDRRRREVQALEREALAEKRERQQQLLEEGRARQQQLRDDERVRKAEARTPRVEAQARQEAKNTATHTLRPGALPLPTPPLPEDHTIRFGPLVVPRDQGPHLQALQSAAVTQGDRLLHCDGSMIDAGTDNVAMAFGAVDASEATIRTAQGRVAGHASSTKAELMGLLVVICSAPPEQDIIVRLDNSAVVDQYQTLVANRSSTLPRKRQRANFAALWAVLARVVEERPGATAVQWVRGHSTDRGNTLADGVATTAVRGDTPAWQVDLTQQDELKVLASCAGTPLEMDVRQFLKQQTTIRHHQALLAQKTVKRAVPDFEAVEWRSTLSIIHDRRP
ncbi:hypothetical protein BGZ70_005423, partial [Mortierella alpina]